MNIKKIEKIAKNYSKIEQYHKDVIALESIVENILRTENGITISISCEKPKENKLELDSDGSIISRHQIMMNALTYSAFGLDYGKTKSNVNTLNFESGLNDLLSLELIGMLIREKKNAIENLIKNCEI